MVRDLGAAHNRVLARAARSTSGCLVSAASTGSHGYVNAWDGETVALAHRLVWEMNRGQVPAGMTIHHVCHNKRCVEIDHMRTLSNLENARRTNGREWGLGLCARGHDDRSYWRPKGLTRQKGYCSACRADIQRARRARSQTHASA